MSLKGYSLTIVAQFLIVNSKKCLALRGLLDFSLIKTHFDAMQEACHDINDILLEHLERSCG